MNRQALWEWLQLSRSAEKWGSERQKYRGCMHVTTCWIVACKFRFHGFKLPISIVGRHSLSYPPWMWWSRFPLEDSFESYKNCIDWILYWTSWLSGISLWNPLWSHDDSLRIKHKRKLHWLVHMNNINNNNNNNLKAKIAFQSSKPMTSAYYYLSSIYLV